MRVFPRDQRGCWRPPPSHPQASVWEVLSGFQRQHRHFLMSRTGCPQQGVKRLPTPQTLFRLPVASVILNFLSPAVSYISFLQSILYHPLKLSFLFIYVIVLWSGRKFLFSFIPFPSTTVPLGTYSIFTPGNRWVWVPLHAFSASLWVLYLTRSQALKRGSIMLGTRPKGFPRDLRALVSICRLWWWWLVWSWGDLLGVEQERWKRQGPEWTLGCLSPHWPSSLNLLLVPQNFSFSLLGSHVGLASPRWCLHWQGLAREPISIV